MLSIPGNFCDALQLLDIFFRPINTPTNVEGKLSNKDSLKRNYCF